jgi:hypothetical protein
MSSLRALPTAKEQMRYSPTTQSLLKVKKLKTITELKRNILTAIVMMMLSIRLHLRDNMMAMRTTRRLKDVMLWKSQTLKIDSILPVIKQKIIKYINFENEVIDFVIKIGEHNRNSSMKSCQDYFS